MALNDINKQLSENSSQSVEFVETIIQLLVSHMKHFLNHALTI